MVSKPRVPMHVSPKFEKRVKELQKKIRKKNGENMSLRDITENLINLPDFEKLEKNLLSGGEELQLNLDQRRR